MGARMGTARSKSRVIREYRMVEYAVRMPKLRPRKAAPTSSRATLRIRFMVAVVMDGIKLLSTMEMPLTPPGVK